MSKQTKLLKVKITKHPPRPTMWWANLVGKEIEVYEVQHETFTHYYALKEDWDKGRGNIRVIPRDAVKIVE